jgi:hypothetical protein
VREADTRLPLSKTVMDSYEEIPKASHDPDHINPKIASDIRYWAHQFQISGQLLHEAIRVHSTSVEKVRRPRP